MVVFVVALLMIFGAAPMTGTVDLVPEFSPTLVEIQTEAVGLAADEVEALITVPLEEFLAGLPWLQAKRSSSNNGLSSIVLEFQPGTNLFRARQMVQEWLSNVQITSREAQN